MAGLAIPVIPGPEIDVLGLAPPDDDGVEPEVDGALVDFPTFNMVESLSAPDAGNTSFVGSLNVRFYSETRNTE